MSQTSSIGERPHDLAGQERVIISQRQSRGKFNSPTYFQSVPKRRQDSLLCRLDKVFKSNGIVKQNAVGERLKQEGITVKLDF
ncbi:hypothetical protein TNCV_4088651 [Trichonephila clavipes]|nr:hypothetical protein TNCV_4088651 [Trichonephila clavipes]